MPVWLLLLSLPFALVLLSGLLALSAFVENRVLSPRSLIVSAARARRTDVELTEALVTRESERLLRNRR